MPDRSIDRSMFPIRCRERKKTTGNDDDQRVESIDHRGGVNLENGRSILTARSNERTVALGVVSARQCATTATTTTMATTTAREVAPEILSQFWTLASEDGDARRRACEALVGALRGEHRRRDDASGKSGGGGARGEERRRDDDDDDDDDDEDEEEETNGRASEGVKEYALRRLTRGLSSGRGGARQGFALALCELACEPSGPSPKEALRALDANLAPITKGTKGMEARDILLGRLFGAAAVARALESRKDVGEEERVECGASVVERARALAKEKAYLAEPAAACVIEVKNSLGIKTFASVAERVEGLGEWLSADCSAEAGADTLWLACELYDALPAKMRETIGCVPQTASSGGKKASKGGVNWAEMFTRTHLRKISNALTEGANTHPRVHSAWEMMLREAKKVGGNVQLWETVCEDGLFVSGSHHKRFLGFRIFDSMLSEAEAHEIPALFSANFVKCLLNNLSSPDNYLHECAVDCLARIVAFASDTKTDSEKKIAVIAALQRQGPTRFDNVTKTNAVQDLVKGLDADDATRYMESMYDVVTTTPEQDPDVLGTEEELASALANGAGQKRRLWALEQMAGLSAMLPKEKTVELMQFMLFHAFYKLSGKATKAKSRVPDFIRKNPLGEPTGSVRTACATRFLAMINSNIRAQRSAANKDDESKVEVVDLLTEAVTFCRDLEKDKSIEMFDAIPGEYQEVRDELFKALDACDASEDDLAAKVTPLIRVLSLLQVSDWREFTPALQDLPRCVGELIDAKKKKRSKKGDEEEPQAIDVLTDILFSLLAQPSALLRDVVEHTFKAVSGRVSKEGIQDMLRIIAGPEVTDEGDEDEEEDDLLTEADDSDDSEAEDSEEEEDDDSDDDSDDDDSEGEEDHGEANEAEIAAMRAAASKVLGTTNDDDDDDSESEDMDDAAMFRIDKLLAEAFKSRQQDLMRKKNLKRATRDFKFRVISLFELYAKAQPGSAYLPGAAVTLLDATREALGKQDPQSTQLAERLASLISKHISHARDLPELIGDEVTAESLQAGLKSIIVATNKGAGEAKVFNRASSAAAAYLLRVLEAVVLHESGAKAPATGEEVASSNSVACFREALEMFKSKRSKLKTSFFSQMFAKHPALAAALLPELFGLVALDADKANARGEFLRLEALKLVNPVIQSSKKRYPSLAKSVKKSIKLVSASLAAAIAAPYKNKNTRADACQQVAVCIESLDRLLGDTSIKSIIDVDAITDAIAKQMSKPPAIPQKASKAFARICNLLGCAVPDVEMREASDDEDVDGGDSDSDIAPEKPEKKRKKSAGDKSAKKKKKK